MPGTVVAAAYSDDGALWFVEERSPRDVWRLDPGGARGAVPVWSANEGVADLRRGGGPTIVATTGARAARLGSAGVLKTWDVPGIRDVLPRADGSIAMAVNDWSGPVHQGLVEEDRDGTLRVLFRHRSRIIEMAERGDALWVAYDFGLARVARDGPVELVNWRVQVVGPR